MIDDATAFYIHQVHPHFEDLKQVASQLAGLLVLSAAGGTAAGPHHPMLCSAKQLHESAADAVRSARATRPARKHHQHLIQAVELLQQALHAAHTGTEIDPVLTPLRAAYDQLEQAADSLPGFGMISFNHACCARVAHV